MILLESRVIGRDLLSPASLLLLSFAIREEERDEMSAKKESCGSESKPLLFKPLLPES